MTKGEYGYRPTRRKMMPTKLVIKGILLFDFVGLLIGIRSQRIPTQFVFAKEWNRNVHKQNNDGH